jgi:hypothetical protein
MDTEDNASENTVIRRDAKGRSMKEKIDVGIIAGSGRKAQ